MSFDTKMKLIYLKQWGKGRAELSRLILAHVEAEYEDCRIEMEEWVDLQPSKEISLINFSIVISLD